MDKRDPQSNYSYVLKQYFPTEYLREQAELKYMAKLQEEQNKQLRRLNGDKVVEEESTLDTMLENDIQKLNTNQTNGVMYTLTTLLYALICVGIVYVCLINGSNITSVFGGICAAIGIFIVLPILAIYVFGRLLVILRLIGL